MDWVLKRRTLTRRSILALSGFTALDFATGCNNTGKESEAVASEAVDVALGLLERDVPQVRNGVPEGAIEIATRLPDDPIGKREELRTAIKNTREKIDNLAFSKISFMSFATPDGKVLRSESEPDKLADQNIIKAFAPLEKVHEQKGYVEAYGQMDALRGVLKGNDTAWIVASSVVGKDGKPVGILLAGWSFRLYARVLETGVRNKIGEKLKEQNKVLPLIYIYILKGNAAYGDPDAPDVNADELVKLKALEEASKGTFTTNREIEKRVFGIVAKKAPLLGDDAAIAAVASVF